MSNRQKILLGSAIVGGLAVGGVLAYRRLNKKKLTEETIYHD